MAGPGRTRIAVHSSASRADHGGGVTWLVSAAAVLAERHDVDLYFPSSVDEADIRRLLPSLHQLPHVRQPRDRWKTRIIGELREASLDLAYDVVLVQSPHVPRLMLNRRAYLFCEFPFTREPAFDDRIRLRSYRAVVGCSAFAARWIERRWQRPASVLYPAVAPIPPQPKRPFILATGRFTGGGRSKRQLEMVAMFEQLVEGGLKGWELHLAGFAHDPAYVEQVVQRANRLPVHLHLNLDRTELEALYGVSSIFWHATGAGIDPEAEPERMEHFGIVTVEAMSAGCVPVVINGGGQPEIVGEAGNGVLWNSFEECVEATRQLAHDESRRVSLAERASEHARRFSFPAFRDRVLALVDESRAGDSH